MGSPRVDVVFRLWQCDKENHGWREGPPRPSLASFDLLVGPSPSRLSQLQTKKEYTFSIGCEPSLTTLAGLKPHIIPDPYYWKAVAFRVQPSCPTSGSRVIQQLSGRAHRRPGCTGGQCTRGCLRDRVGLPNGGNIAPTTRRCRQSMAASACRMITRSSFPDRELLD